MPYKLEIFNRDGTKIVRSRSDLRTAEWEAVRALSEGHTVRLRLPGFPDPIFYLAPMSHEENIRRIFERGRNPQTPV